MRPTSFPGHELRARREELGLTVYDAFRKIRVPISYIEALERGEFTALPATCYTVGFLKSYCQFLGLDANRFVDTFRACSRPSVRRFLRRKTEREYVPPAWLNEVLTWAVITAVLILGWVAYTVVIRPQSPLADRGVEAGTVEMVVPPVQTDDDAL